MFGLRCSDRLEPNTEYRTRDTEHLMDALFWFNVLTRWLHITSAVVGVGALLFLWLVLQPALAAEPACPSE